MLCYIELLCVYVNAVCSVERLLDHLVLTGNSTLDPLQACGGTRGQRCQITLKKNYQDDPKLLFAMFYIYGYVL